MDILILEYEGLQKYLNKTQSHWTLAIKSKNTKNVGE